MAGTQDMNKFFENFMASFPMDTAIFDDAVEKQSATSKKYYDLFLGVAEKSTTVTYKWATETLAKMQKAPSYDGCLLYTSPSPRDLRASRMPSSA